MRIHPFFPLLFAAATLSAAAPPITSAAFTRTIAETTKYIQEQMAAQGVEGLSVALIDHEEIVWAQGFGWADHAAGKPVAPDTTFHIGSVSKMFVTAAVMALVEDGKVDLDAPVVRYLPSFRLRSPGYEDITVRMLLNHQSGMPGSMYNFGLSVQPVLDYTDRLNNWLSHEYRQYPARFATVYTNNGFELAEEVVVAVSGTSYIDFLRGRILKPLALNQTGIDFLAPALAAALSKPYIDGKEQSPEIVNLIGTGGLTSTPSDLCRFLAMINGGGTAFGTRVLSTNSIAEMARDYTKDTVVQITGATMAPGLGWDNQSDRGLAYAGAAHWKSGATLSFSADVIAFPKYSLAFAITSNKVNGASHRICNKALTNALEERYSVPTPAPIQASAPAPAPVDLASLEGFYGSAAMAGIWQLRTTGQTVELWLRKGSSFLPMYTGLTMRADGWLAGESDSIAFAVRTIGGRTLLLVRSNEGHYQTVDPIGEKLNAPPNLSPAWRDRLGKTYVAIDTDPLAWEMEKTIPVLRLAERSGHLTVEYLSTLQSGGGQPSAAHRLLAERVRTLRPTVQTDPDGIATADSLVYEPLNDRLASVPLLVDCRDVTYLQIALVSNEEWLRVGSQGSVWRPLDGIPEADARLGYNARISPARAAWVKLPVDGRHPAWQLNAAAEVRWVLYDEDLQPIDSGRGQKSVQLPDTSSSRVLYVVLYSTKNAYATITPGQGSR
jgi:CubicO group peptidase (beta-lactamase class C family)